MKHEPNAIIIKMWTRFFTIQSCKKATNNRKIKEKSKIATDTHLRAQCTTGRIIYMLLFAFINVSFMILRYNLNTVIFEVFFILKLKLFLWKKKPKNKANNWLEIENYKIVFFGVKKTYRTIKLRQ